MKKCPLLKITMSVENFISENETATDSVEKFQDCIGEECTAWNYGDNICEYFTLQREVRIYRQG